MSRFAKISRPEPHKFVLYYATAVGVSVAGLLDYIDTALMPPGNIGLILTARPGAPLTLPILFAFVGLLFGALTASVILSLNSKNQKVLLRAGVASSALGLIFLFSSLVLLPAPSDTTCATNADGSRTCAGTFLYWAFAPTPVILWAFIAFVFGLFGLVKELNFHKGE